jgi:large subunit ribosomal protein L18
MGKQESKRRRTDRFRFKLKRISRGNNDLVRLCVHKTSQHIYAQLIKAEGGKILTAASTLEKEIKQEAGYGGNINAAKIVGKFIGQRAKQLGCNKVVFDRSGFKYHGRIKALADAAREVGLEF